MRGHLATSLLHAYLNGELSGRRRERVEAHLRECRICGAEYAELREALQLVSRYGRRSCPLDPRDIALTVWLRSQPAAAAQAWIPTWRRVAAWALIGSTVAGLLFALHQSRPSRAVDQPPPLALVRTEPGFLHESYRSQQALGEMDGLVLTVAQTSMSRR